MKKGIFALSVASNIIGVVLAILAIVLMLLSSKLLGSDADGNLLQTMETYKAKQELNQILKIPVFHETKNVVISAEIVSVNGTDINYTFGELLASSVYDENLQYYLENVLRRAYRGQDVKVRTGTEVFGIEFDSPVALIAVASHKLFVDVTIRSKDDFESEQIRETLREGKFKDILNEVKRQQKKLGIDGVNDAAVQEIYESQDLLDSPLAVALIPNVLGDSLTVVYVKPIP